MDLQVKATTAYQAAGNLNVTNNFGHKHEQLNNQVAWAAAVAMSCSDSVVMFNDRLNLLFFNNAFKTFPLTPPKNVYELARHMTRHYRNSNAIISAVTQCAESLQPCFFSLHPIKQCIRLECSAIPVIGDERLLGYLLVAKKTDGSKTEILCKRKSQRGE
jgi:hypothetical protein